MWALWSRLSACGRRFEICGALFQSAEGRVACAIDDHAFAEDQQTSNCFRRYRTAAITGAAGAGTVQEPRVCHPLVCVPLVAYMKMVCDPANAGVNVTANVSVNVFPLGTAVLVPNAIAHWLFCRVPLPSAADIQVPPASSSR